MSVEENSNEPRDERLLVTVVRLAGDLPSQVSGEVVSVARDEATLRLPGDSPFESGEPVVLVRGKVGARQSARASWARTEGGCEVFSMAAPFEPFDVRRDPRFATRLAVEIRDGDVRERGTMLDISNGGAAVAVGDRPKGTTLLLAISSNGFSAMLPCRVVGTSATGGPQMLHLKFEHLNAAEQAFLRQLVRDALAAAQETAQLAA